MFFWKMTEKNNLIFFVHRFFKNSKKKIKFIFSGVHICAIVDKKFYGDFFLKSLSVPNLRETVETPTGQKKM